MRFGWANTISVVRTLMAIGVVVLLGALSTVLPSVTAWGLSGKSLSCCLFWLTGIIIALDGLDGYVARKFNEASPLGAVMDIVSDRVVEQVYWLGFAGLGWVPIAVPLIVIVRGTIVDSLRAIALEQGMTAFGSTTMMQHPLGVALVSSRASRWLYAVAKLAVFMLLIGQARTLSINGQVTPWGFLSAAWVEPVNTILVWGCVVFCVIRGLPVLLESPRLFQKASASQ